MRKKIFRRTILLFLPAVIVFACKEEDGLLLENDKLPPEVVEAKTWYESQATEGNLLWKPVNSRESNVLNPNWENVFSNENADYKVMEIQLDGNEKFVLVSSECAEKYRKTRDKRYKVSDARLVIRTDKKTDEKDGFIMVVCPDLSYLEAHKNNPLKDISYLKRDAKFSGMIYFHNMNGEFVNGWKYMDGKLYAFYPETTQLDNSQLRAVYTVWWCQVTEHWIDWYSNGHYTGSTFGGTFEECHIMYEYETGGGYENDGGGSGNENGNTNRGNPGISKISKANHLDNSGKIILEDELAIMLQKCGYSYMNNFIMANGYEFKDIVYNSSLAGGGYDPTTGILAFKNNNFIRDGIFQEEFVHLYQDAYYSGINVYTSNNGMLNIEFEAKLIQDIICYMWAGGCQYFGRGANHAAKYEEWVVDITRNGTYFPSYEDIRDDYWDYLQDFQQRQGLPYYNLPIKWNLNPNALNSIHKNYPTGGCNSSVYD